MTVSSEKSRSHEESSAAKVSVLNAGNDLTLIAGEDITSKGAQIDVGGDATLDAGGEIVLEAADNTMASSGKNSSKSAGISVTAGVSRTGAVSVSAGVNASIQNGKHESEQSYKTNSKLNVAGNLDLASGADTTLKGAQVTAKTADLDVGGDLNIESIQDTGSNSSSSAGASGGLSVDIFTGNVSGNLSVNGSKGEGSRAWVTEQTGIVTEETLEIDVTGNTDLKGGLIASDTDDLTLSTRTLTFSDIDDHDKQSNIGGSVGVNFTVPGPAGTDKSGETGPEDQPDNTSDQTDSEESEAETSYGGQFEGSYANRDKRQITRATVREGEIIIRDEDKQQELEDSGETESIDELNRDVDLAQEVTKDEEEYVGVYVSDTAVVAVIEAGKKIGEVIDQVKKSLIASEQLSPEEASIGAKVYSDLLDKKIPPESLRACLSNSASIWDWIIPSAYASTACSVYSIQEIKACLKFDDTVKYAAAESSANMLEQFNVAYENDPEGLEKALKALDIPTEIILKSGLVDKQAYEKFQEDIGAAVTKGTDEVLATIEQYSNGDPEKAVILATLVTGTALALAPKKTRAKILEKLKEPLRKVAREYKRKSKGIVAEYNPLNKGPLPIDIVETFRSGTYNEVVITRPTILYRVISENGNPTGGYWTRSKPKGPFQSVIDSALDQNWGNSATKVIEMKVPVGTKFFEGIAAQQRGLVGGGNQIYFDKKLNPLNPSWIR
nr:hemagglutinin repeat-containing protein [Pseudovibrio sp. Ad37]